MNEKTVPVHARIAVSTRDIAKAHARRLHISDAAYYRLAIETLNGIQSAKSRVAGPEIVYGGPMLTDELVSKEDWGA